MYKMAGTRSYKQITKTRIVMDGKQLVLLTASSLWSRAAFRASRKPKTMQAQRNSYSKTAFLMVKQLPQASKTDQTCYRVSDKPKAYLQFQHVQTTAMYTCIHCNNLVFATEEGFSRVHLCKYAAQRPHVNGEVVRNAQQDLGRPIKSTLNVLEHLCE